MSIFCTTEKSSIGTVFHKIARRPLAIAFSSSESESSCINNDFTRGACRKRPFHQSSPKDASVDTWFVNTLVTASECRKNTWERPHSPRPLQPKSWLQIRPGHSRFTRRCNHTKPIVGNCRDELITREELLALVDQYEGNSLTNDLPIIKLPDLKQTSSPEPELVVSETKRDANWPPQIYVWPSQGEGRKAVEKLETSLTGAQLKPEEYYQLYRDINAPRVTYLRAASRHALLKRLGVLERKDEQAMLRYLSVVDDMKATGIPLTIAEWNIAISFAGRYVAMSGAAEVEGALRVWREMEYVARIRSNAASFNILFDVATKAGKFRLAEMIYQEMDRRGHSFNRFHHVSVIHYHGLRGDGEGIRKAYRSLVDSREVVDIVVLNCMISSFIRACEPQAAMHIYEAMKRLHESKSGTSLPHRNYSKSRQVAKSLIRLAKSAKRNPARLRNIQKHTDLTPDIKTFRALIQHVAVKSGELHKTAQLLDEMQLFNVPLHGSVFLALFKAFATHGHVRYTQWTASRLESVWKAYLLAAKVQNEEVYIGKWVVFWALKAFKSSVGEDRAIQAWDEIRRNWSPNDDDLSLITGILVGQ